MIGVLDVLDPADVLPSLADYHHDWSVRGVPTVEEPRCDLPCPEHYRREWWHAERKGVTRCHAAPGHPPGTCHYGIVVTEGKPVGAVGEPVPGVHFTLYQWPQSEADAPAGDR